MPYLPENLDNRFNFYLNYLPYIEPIGFWGGLIVGITLLIYAVTRATLKLSKLSKNSRFLELNYRCTNLLQADQNSIYKPCMMKLIKSNEKSNVIQSNNGLESDDLYAELQLGLTKQSSNMSSKRGSFALELEPALESTADSNSCGEGHESYIASTTLSRNSSTLSHYPGNIKCGVDVLKTDTSNSHTADQDENLADEKAEKGKI